MDGWGGGVRRAGDLPALLVDAFFELCLALGRTGDIQPFCVGLREGNAASENILLQTERGGRIRRFFFFCGEGLTWA